MNLQTGSTPPRRQRRGTTQNQGHPIAALFIKLSVLAIIAFVTFNKFNDYQTQTQQLEASKDSIDAEIAELESEIQYLKDQKETFERQDHIYEKVAKFNLKLRPAEPLQVRSLENPTAHVAYVRTRTRSREHSVALARR